MATDTGTEINLIATDSASDADAVLAAMRSRAPHIDRIATLYGDDLPAIREGKGEAIIAEAEKDFLAVMEETTDEAAAMSAIRKFRMRINHVVAMTDFLGLAEIEDHFRWLSDAAGKATAATAEWIARQPRAENNDGWFILALGKLGSRELNYSSDIDLIVILTSRGTGGTAVISDEDAAREATYVKMTRRLVQMLTKPTGDGIGWRVDLRLRPNPSSTPVAIRYATAMGYYESMARTWERAAFIRARPVAGNITAGEDFLKAIDSFIWHQGTDMSVLEDMRVMLRREDRKDDLLGYNIKNGIGGIRSVEFFLHVEQLIEGRKREEIHTGSTRDALALLVGTGRITEEQSARLYAAYRQWRRLEHRLQMLGDTQTQTMPKNPDDFENFAAFCGYDADTGAFRRNIIALGDSVIADTAELVDLVENNIAEGGDTEARDIALEKGEAPPEPVPAPQQQPDELERRGALLTAWLQGGEADNEAAHETMMEMGFKDTKSILPIAEGWMDGSIPATDSHRGRVLLMRLLPRLLADFSQHANPDASFRNFAALLSGLPAGVQLLSMLESNESISRTMSTILSSAPRLAENLGIYPGIMEGIMYGEFWNTDIDWAHRRAIFEDTLTRDDKLHRDDPAAAYDAKLDILRHVRREWEFQSTIHLLTCKITAADAGVAFAELADLTIHAIMPHVAARTIALHGALPAGKGAFAVLAFGRLGIRDMTTGSDLDLVPVYDCGDDIGTDGKKPIDGKTWHNRMARNFTQALAAKTPAGTCYDVDTRLRPGGMDGPLASHIDAFARYETRDAWLWEHLALLKARIVGGWRHEKLAARITEAINDALDMERDPAEIRKSVADMRSRVRTEFTAKTPMDIRYREGGLMDLDFLLLMLQLMPEAREAKITRTGHAARAAKTLGDAGLLEAEEAAVLGEAAATLGAMHQWFRLTGVNPDDDTALIPEAMQEVFGIGDIAALKKRIETITGEVAAALAKHLQ